MALTECKECGKEISTKAKACPHCGAGRGMSGWWKLSIFALISSIVIWAIFSFISPAIYTPEWKKANNRVSKIKEWKKSASSIMQEYTEYHDSIDQKHINDLVMSGSMDCQKEVIKPIEKIKLTKNKFTKLETPSEFKEGMKMFISSFDEQINAYHYLREACLVDDVDNKISLINLYATHLDLASEKMQNGLDEFKYQQTKFQ